MDVNNEKKAIIELQGICKSFSVGKRTAKVLKGIDLSIPFAVIKDTHLLQIDLIQIKKVFIDL